MKILMVILSALALILQTGCSKEVVIETSQFSTDAVTREAGVVTILDAGDVSPIVIQNGSYTVLVDTGDKGSYELIKDSLVSMDISTIDCMIVTSPIREFCGNAASIINDFNVRRVIKPKLAEENNSLSAEWVEFVEQLQISNVDYLDALYGVQDKLGEVTFTCMGPQGDSYMNDADFGMASKFQFGMVQMMYMSSCGSVSEQELITGRVSSNVDILISPNLKDTKSNSSEFIGTLSPQLVVMSAVDKVSEEVTDRYTGIEGTEVHLVSDEGRITITTDGANIGYTSSYFESKEVDE